MSQACKKPVQEVLAGGPGQQLLQATRRVAEVQRQLDQARASAATAARRVHVALCVIHCAPAFCLVCLIWCPYAQSP